MGISEEKKRRYKVFLFICDRRPRGRNRKMLRYRYKERGEYAGSHGPTEIYTESQLLRVPLRAIGIVNRRVLSGRGRGSLRRGRIALRVLSLIGAFVRLWFPFEYRWSSLPFDFPWGPECGCGSWSVGRMRISKNRATGEGRFEITTSNVVLYEGPFFAPPLKRWRRAIGREWSVCS